MATKKTDADKAIETPDHSVATAVITVDKKIDLDAGESINEVLKAFLLDISSIQKTHQIVLPHVLKWLQKQHSDNAGKLKKYQSEREDQPDMLVAKSTHQVAEILEAVRALDGLGGLRIPQTLEKSLFTQLFAEFDAFIGALLKVIYRRKADLLKGISREITFADLLAYENLNAVKLDMLEKEIESFRRESYVEQFSSLEKKFGLKLRAFPEWGEFVELSQRRNLIVHNGGCVSDQYLIVCDREGHKFDPRPQIGSSLKPDIEYFSRAIIIVSKVAFMLSHTLWSKVFPDERKQAQTAANDVIYDLLSEKRWRSASAIAKFCLTEPMRKELEEIDLRIRTINAAIAMKFSGNQEECTTCLKAVDWTASYRDFKLAIAVLHDNFVEAAALMRVIGKSGELIQELSYHEWPLFHKFRDSADFLAAYKDIYGISFVLEAVRQSTEAAKSSEADLKKDLAPLDVTPKSSSKVGTQKGRVKEATSGAGVKVKTASRTR